MGEGRREAREGERNPLLPESELSLSGQEKPEKMAELGSLAAPTFSLQGLLLLLHGTVQVCWLEGMCHITGDSQYGGVALPPEAASQGSELSLEGGGGALIHYVWILDECFLLIASTSRVMGSQTDAPPQSGSSSLSRAEMPCSLW